MKKCKKCKKLSNEKYAIHLVLELGMLLGFVSFIFMSFLLIKIFINICESIINFDIIFNYLNSIDSFGYFYIYATLFLVGLVSYVLRKRID